MARPKTFEGQSDAVNEQLEGKMRGYRKHVLKAG
jgi:hypothetical protein